VNVPTNGDIIHSINTTFVNFLLIENVNSVLEKNTENILVEECGNGKKYQSKINTIYRITSEVSNMLFECEEHGYYRGETCPICGKKGKFLMNDRELNSLSRIIAGALRHFPDKLRLDMDGHGWVEISHLIEAIGSSRSGFNWLRLHHIQALAATDPRGRYQIDGGMIRAKYGHSIDVNLDDLPIADADEFFYPVTEEEADIVLENGIQPIDRKKVHLSTTIEKAVEAGSVRSDHPLIIRVDGEKARENGVEIFQASNDVCVTESIDAEYLTQVDDEVVDKILKEKR